MSIHKLSFAVAVLALLATQALAQSCGDICTAEFWETATPDEITAAAQGGKRLSGGRIQAIFAPDSRQLGECRWNRQKPNNGL